LKFKKKESKNSEEETTFSVQGKLSNFDEGVELNEHTPSPFCFAFLNFCSK
jgi:hypothetical protein